MSFWGTSFVSTKILLNNGLTPPQIYIIRFSIAYIGLLLFSYRKLKSDSWIDEFRFLLCGFTGGSIYFITENEALKNTLITNVALIVTIAPLLTTLLACIFLKNEKIKREWVLGSIIAFMGVGGIIFNNGFYFSLNPIGDLLSISAALSWALYSVILKLIPSNYSTIFVTRKVFLYGIITSIPFVYIFPANDISDIVCRPTVIFNLLFLGVGASMLAFMIWNYIVKTTNVVYASNILYVGPLISFVSAAIILDERITLVGGIGGLFVLSGVIIAEKVKIWKK